MLGYIVSEGRGTADRLIREVAGGAIPPELLVATLREQLATQLKETYEKEREAQRERIKVERERATADQQETLVRAEIEKAAAEHRKEQLRLLGEGEKLKLLEIAKGADIGTLLSPRTEKLAARKQWLAGHLVVRGNLQLDEGASKALSGSGVSLLAVGVRQAYGAARPRRSRGHVTVARWPRDP